VDNEKFLTREEFRKFVDNHFHTLTVEVAKLAGGQKVAIILLTAIVGLVAVVVGLSVV
tara:strand:+ start:1524 stop:1697 length:174 start_codon:yes stop_codon:yes gene_type:complete